MGCRRQEGGFTLVELMISLAMFAMLSTGFWMVMLGAQRGSTRAQDVVGVSGEARLGLNRMIRDTREAQSIVASSGSSYTIKVDFDYDGVPVPYPSLNPQGDFEELTYAFNSLSETITLNGEVLMRRVRCINTGGPCLSDVFAYTSNRLEYDWNSDGTVTCLELDDAADPIRGVVGVGNNNNLCDFAEWPLISGVQYAMLVATGESDAVFRSEAQMRNQR